MIRIVFTLVFIAACLLQAAAETTYVLIDHSASMAADDSQYEAQIDLAHYLQNLNATDEVSIAYFGGQNGGDCESDVEVPIAVPQIELTDTNPTFPADGDNPLLAAIDAISARHGSEEVDVVVLSDFDAVCGATRSACMAIYGYRQQHPNLSFSFEPVGEAASEKPLFQCLFTSSTVSASNEPKRFEFDVDISANDPEDKRVYSNWLVTLNFLVAFALMLLTGWLVSIGSRHNAKVRGHSGDLVVRKYIFQRGKVSVTAMDVWVIALLVIFAITFFVSYYVFSPFIEPSFDQTFHVLNDRFGAGVASTLLVGFLGWVAYTTYNDRLLRLESGFSKKLAELQSETQRNKHQQILSDLESSFEQNLEMLEAQKNAVKQLPAYEESDNLDGLHAELITSVRNLWAAVRTSVTIEKPDPWRKSSFLRPMAFFREIGRNAPDSTKAAEDYATKLREWNKRCDEITSRTRFDDEA